MVFFVPHPSYTLAPPPAWRGRFGLTALAAAALALAASQARAQTATASAALPQVEVQAQAAPVAAGASATVEGEALERAGSMADIVRYQPLVSAPGIASGGSRNRSSFDRGGTTGYNIRGIEGNRVGMDIDGVELPEAVARPYAGRSAGVTTGVGRDYIDPEMFSGVDIASGTTTARRAAGGIGGSVGFRTKSVEDYLAPDSDGHYFGAKAGHETANRMWNESVTAAARAGNTDALLAYSRRDGHQTRNHSGTVQAYPDDWHSNALLLKGGVHIDGSQRLLLSADVYQRQNRTRFDGWDNDGNAVSDHSRQHNDTQRHTVQLQHLLAGAAHKLDTRLYWQGTKTGDVTDTTTLADGEVTHNVSETRTRTWGFSSTLDWRLGQQQLLSAGVNASTQDTDRPWAVVGLMKPQPDSTIRRLGAFVQDELTWQVGGKRLALTPAIRVDRVQIKPRSLDNFVDGALDPEEAANFYGGSHSNTIVSPSVALVYDVLPALSAYAQFKRSGRAPSIGEIFGSWNMNQVYAGSGRQYALVGNPDMKEESSNAFDVGLKGRPAPGVTFSGSLFYTRYRDFIDYTRYTRALRPDLFANVPTHIGIIYQAENRDNAKVYGLELSARLEHGQWSPALRGLHSTWALGISQGKSKSWYPGDKDVALDSVLPRKAIVALGWDAPQRQWGLGLTGVFVAGKQAVATNRNSFGNNPGTELNDATTQLFRVPGYALFDVGAYWQINKSARLNFGITNLGDKRYWDYASARNLQPAVARDRRDIELYTNPGRSFALSLNMVL